MRVGERELDFLSQAEASKSLGERLIIGPLSFRVQV
jgi:hypothetical protein